MAKMKIKAKEKKGIVKVKAMFTNLMTGEEQAVRLKLDVDYIKYIVAKVNGKIVYEVTTSGFMSENPLIKFKFKGAKKGDKIVFTTIDHEGKKETGKKKIR
jgi:sulfur-oxidizing protein SoxZ